MTVEEFVRESNRIEGIDRDPAPAELEEFIRFMSLKNPKVHDLVEFVDVYQPGALLRKETSIPGVRVGTHIAPPSGKHIVFRLQEILNNMEQRGPYWTHVDYETLHPFTDGNGRSGRMLWAWQMGWSGLRLGFLHMYYYQSLQESRK